MKRIIRRLVGDVRAKTYESKQTVFGRLPFSEPAVCPYHVPSYLNSRPMLCVSSPSYCSHHAQRSAQLKCCCLIVVHRKGVAFAQDLCFPRHSQSRRRGAWFSIRQKSRHGFQSPISHFLPASFLYHLRNILALCRQALSKRLTPHEFELPIPCRGVDLSVELLHNEERRHEEVGLGRIAESIIQAPTHVGGKFPHFFGTVSARIDGL